MAKLAGKVHGVVVQMVNDGFCSNSHWKAAATASASHATKSTYTDKSSRSWYSSSASAKAVSLAMDQCTGLRRRVTKPWSTKSAKPSRTTFSYDGSMVRYGASYSAWVRSRAICPDWISTNFLANAWHSFRTNRRRSSSPIAANASPRPASTKLVITLCSMGKPWQSQPGTKVTWCPCIRRERTTKSFNTLLRRCPRCRFPLAKGGPSWNTNGSADERASHSFSARLISAHRATEFGSLVARPARMAKSVLGRWRVSFHFLFLGAGASLMP